MVSRLAAAAAAAASTTTGIHPPFRIDTADVFKLFGSQALRALSYK